MAGRRRRATNQRRGGTVMVLFALMMVAILALVGVAIEMGVVRVTRDRMQSAADAAAREILRERDFAISAAAESDDHVRDRERRERNRLLTSWTFDGEGLSEDYAPEEQGAGPYHLLSNGEGNVNWKRVYYGANRKKIEHSIPVLELNQDGSEEGTNLQHGDIVTGTFAPVEFGLDGNPFHLENSEDYVREDFVPNDPGHAPFGDSVLVRLRRTFSPGMPGNNQLDREPGISSSGPTLPLVFTGGSTVIGTDPAAGYSLRHHGLRFRATAIAQSMPAVRVGLARPEYGAGWELGVGTIMMNSESASTSRPWWSSDGSGGMYVLVSQQKYLKLDANVVAGSREDPPFIGVIGIPKPTRVGDEVTFPPWNEEIDWWLNPGYKPADWEGEETYSPLFREWEIAPQVFLRYVCGFMHIKAEVHMIVLLDDDGNPVLDDEGNPVAVPHDGPHGLPYLKITVLGNEMSPNKPWIAPRNASALFDGMQDTTLSAEYWAEIFYRLEAFDHLDLLVHAPALVR